MKILIYNTATGLYLGESDNWVESMESARNFGQTSVAVLHHTALNLPDVELVYAFPNKKDNFSIPINGPAEQSSAA